MGIRPGSLVGALAGNRNRTRGQSLMDSVKEPRSQKKPVTNDPNSLFPADLGKLKR